METPPAGRWGPRRASRMAAGEHRAVPACAAQGRGREHPRNPGPFQVLGTYCTDTDANGTGGSPASPRSEKALSEGHARQRYRDTSLSIWQRQQLKLEAAPPRTHLSRSQSAWYSQYGNEAILVRDRNKLGVSRDTGQSRFCTIM